MSKIVAFDLEGTLTTGSTWRGAAAYLKLKGYGLRYNLMFLGTLPGYLLYKLRMWSEESFKDRWMNKLARFWAGWTQADLAVMAEWVVENHMWPQRRIDVLDEAQARAAAGDRVFIASGTYLIFVQAFARKAGIEEAVATELAMQDGRCLGSSDGPMRVGDLKVENVRDFLGGRLPDAAYGDSEADGAILSQVSEAVAVYPDAWLRARATAEGWRILENQVSG